MRHWTLEGRCLTAATVANAARITASNAPNGTILSYIATKDLLFAIADLESIVQQYAVIEDVRMLRAAIERAANPVQEAAE